MIDFKKLTNEKIIDENGKSYLQRYTENLVNRGDDSSELDSLLEMNKERKIKILKFEEAKASQNKASAEIAQLKRNKEDASEQLKALQIISKEVKGHEKSMSEATEKFEQFLARFPNMVHASVPVGSNEDENQLVDQWGEPGKYGFEVKNHIDLGQSLGIIDFERAGKVAGARFSYLKGMGARLERGLIQFMMDRHAKDHGYTELIPPYIVNSTSMYGTGQFPKFKEDVFHIEGSDYYLIPTSETSVTNLYAGEILKEENLPEKFVAFSPCFRSEAGSYGKDTQGLIRQHQFHKVELLKFSHPEESYEELEQLTSNAESILQDLEIPYRKMALCTGDISFGAAKCYDLEAWLPGQNKYREISSCSNFEDFQARRANIRYRPKGPKAKPQFVHTLNGSGLAVGRTLIAILENHQQEDGSIALPKAIQPYFGGDTKIAAQ